ncbi:deoxyribose-phosphate aldolase [Patescibacteria group bacterium]
MVKEIDKNILASYLDLANHHPDARPEDIKKLCLKVQEFSFNSAFVNGCYVGLARERLGDKGKVGTVVSFPLGQDSQDAKVLAVIKAIKDGADELDVSMNVGWFKAGKTDQVLAEMSAVVEAAKSIKRLAVVKFIIETGFLTNEEIKQASKLVLKSGADFVKTCSGMGPRGAKLIDVELIRQAIGDKVRVKVAGGVHNLKEALGFIEKGADRIGTSKAVEIVNEMVD